MSRCARCEKCIHARKAYAEKDGYVACSFWEKRKQETLFKGESEHNFYGALSREVNRRDIIEGWAYLSLRPYSDIKEGTMNGLQTNNVLIFERDFRCLNFEEYVD